jgi:biopolymer transport protein ExbD
MTAARFASQCLKEMKKGMMRNYSQDHVPFDRSQYESRPDPMKTNKRTVPHEDEPALEVASLIDVCFLLLIYFIATSTIVPREFDLDMSLPSNERLSKDLKLIEPLHIQISASGEIQAGDRFNTQVMDSDAAIRDLPLLQQYLEMFVSASRAANSKPLVRVDADDDVSHQRVIDVLNALAKAEIHAVTFADLLPVP